MEYTEEQRQTGLWVRNLIADKQRGYLAFYQSMRWEQKRAEILRRDRGACQECKKLGRYSKASTVHHVVHLKESPELALTDSNLESVCRDCHELLHPERHKEAQKFTNIERW